LRTTLAAQREPPFGPAGRAVPLTDVGLLLRGLKREDGKAAFLWPFGFGGSSTGDMAWTGLALAQLYADTRVKKYLDGAVALGTWIADKQSPYAFGGYHGGLQADGVTPQKWSSTEHNIDVYAFFTLLAKLTRDRRWATRAETAAAFVQGMWNPDGPFLWTGTLGGLAGEDPNQINIGNIPEYLQTWALLSLDDRRYDDAVDWVTENLSHTDGAVSGVTRLPCSSHSKPVVRPSGSVRASNWSRSSKRCTVVCPRGSVSAKIWPRSLSRNSVTAPSALVQRVVRCSES